MHAFKLMQFDACLTQFTLQWLQIVNPIWQSRRASRVEAETSSITVLLHPDSASVARLALSRGDVIVESARQVLAVALVGGAGELEAEELLVLPEVDEVLGFGGGRGGRGLWYWSGSGHGGGGEEGSGLPTPMGTGDGEDGGAVVDGEGAGGREKDEEEEDDDDDGFSDLEAEFEAELQAEMDDELDDAG